MSRRDLAAELLSHFNERAAAGSGGLARGDIVADLGVPAPTAFRHLDRLVEAGKLHRYGRGRATRYHVAEPPAPGGPWARPGQRHGPAATAPDALAVPWSDAAIACRRRLDLPLGVRQPVGYQQQFVDEYEPNRSALLPPSVADTLYREGKMQGQQPAGTYARNVLSSLLIDLSYSSSHLEGNRYSRLDTEALFGAGRATAPDEDATMLLNHKDAIQFLIDEVPHVGLTGSVVCNLHGLLMQGLLHDENSLGTIREKVVQIGNTVYMPLQFPQLLREMFERIVDKARHIKNPIEAAFFLWVNIAYLQPFEDGNKRTSRLSANIPLLLYNCAPLSFLDVGEADYRDARIGVYEQLDISIAADLFVWTYRRSIRKYADLLKSAPPGDPFRARHRAGISEVVGRVVRERTRLSLAIDALAVGGETALRLHSMIRDDLARLGAHNYARFGLRWSETQQWIADGRPVIA